MVAMSGFGERLRRQREMRGVSLEEISQSTKIGKRSLKAIEDEDFEKLPGGIFNKGFVRAYARFLGLDEEQIVSDFDEAWNAFEAARTPQAVSVPEEPEKKSTSGSVWIAVILLIIAGAAAGWYKYQQTRNQPAPPSNSEADSASAPLASTPSSQSPVPSEPEATATPAPPPVQNGTEAQSSQASQTSQAQTVSQQPKVPAAPSSDATATTASTPSAANKPERPAPIRLQVFAREDSWLSVSADGKDLGQGILGAQKTRSIRAQKEVRLRVGNLAGVEISFNGQPVDVDGQPKQVKELIFTAEGLQQ